jgi:PAS domain S-box-containing protein
MEGNQSVTDLTDFVYAFLVNPDGILESEWVSETFSSITGFSLEDLAGPEGWGRLAHPEDRPVVRQHWESLRAGKPGVVDFRILTSDGEVRWLRSSGWAEAQQQGRSTLRIFGTARDITERIQSDVAIRKQADDLALINTLNDAVNRGDSLQEILGHLTKEIRQMFSGKGAVVYMLSPDRSHLILGGLDLLPGAIGRVERLIGRKLPAPKIPLQEGGLFHEILQAKGPKVIADTEVVQRVALEHANSSVMQQLVPDICRILDFDSLVAMPLVSGDELIGLLGVSPQDPLVETDLERLETISGQLTTILRRKQIEEQLREYHDHLEELVAERTAELFMAAREAGRLNEQLLNEVDERRQTQEALRASIRRWHATFDAISDVVLLTDTAGIVQRCNQAATRLFALPFEQLLGRSYEDLLQAELDGESGYPFRRVQETCRQARQVLPWRDRWFSVTVDPLLDDNQDLVGGVHILSDITERRWAEEEIRRRNKELLALNAIATVIGQSRDIGSILSVVLEEMVEVVGMEGGCVYLLDEDEKSTTLMACLGLDVERFEGILETGDLGGEVIRTGQAKLLALETDVVPFAPPGDDPGAGPMLVGIPLKSKDSLLGVLVLAGSRQLHPDGQEIQLLHSVANEVGMAIDNLRLSRQAAEVQILRELDRLRSRLLANVSHELRTPLGLIKLLSTMLLSEEVALDTQVQRQFLLDIEAETDKLESIVDNLLDLSRMESGHLHLNKVPVDLGELVRRILDSMQLQAPGHRLVYDLPKESLMAIADAKRIEQVLSNLLINAIKYSPDGGSVVVQGRVHQGEVLVAVQDEGIGIPDRALERVFERFYRVENEVTEQVSGVGLGLPICRAIVQAHGGRIWAESALGVGSRFCFTLTANSASSLR